MLLGSSGAYMRLVLLSTILPAITMAQDATAIATASPIAVAVVAPECARSCVQNSQHVQSNCAETDQACLCQHSSIIQAAISSCLDASKACSDSDQQQAVAYYPQFCAGFGLSSDGTAAATGADGIITAAGQAPTQVSRTGASSLVLTGTAGGSRVTETVTAEDSNNHSGTGLTVPAILGITLGIFLAVIGIAAFVVYIHVRHRQLKRRTRLEFLASEFSDQFAEMNSPVVQRPPRSQSMRSHFVVQPTPPEKQKNDFDFGINISRTSTLVSVAPPPPAKVNTNKDLPDIRTSTCHVEHAAADSDTYPGDPIPTGKIQRSSTLREFIGSSGKRLRASLMGSRSTSSATKKSKGAATSSANETYDIEKDGFDDTNKF